MLEDLSWENLVLPKKQKQQKKPNQTKKPRSPHQIRNYLKLVFFL